MIYRIFLPVLRILFFVSIFIILSLFLLFFAVNLVHPAPKQISYGVNFSPYYARDDLNLDWKKVYLALLDEMQIKKVRLVAYWNKIETSPDVYDFSDLDWQIEEANKRDVKITLALGRKVPRYPECHDPIFLKGKSQDYAQGRLLNLVAKVVDRYKGNSAIELWQVENEPFFPFGKCTTIFQDPNFIKTEVNFVKSLDPTRKILTQDSGEGGAWPYTYSFADYLGISMYRRIFFDFWILPKSIYFKYPLPSWSYRIKSALSGIPLNKLIVTELQAEPWGDKPIIQMTQKEKDLTMDKERFISTLDYAKQTRISQFYLWGAEWWYFEKERGNSFYWDTAKELFQES